jgi:glyoxylase-like metal-dependent hydrolase (beta-lactamase superfamily II)
MDMRVICREDRLQQARLHTVAFAAAAVALTTFVGVAQQPPAAPAVAILPVQGAISMLTTAGGNVTVQVGKNGIVLVDTPPADLAPAVIAELGRLSPRPIRHIIQTSVSLDRIGGTAALMGPAGGRSLPLGVGLFGFGAREAVRPNVAAQENVLNRLSSTTPAVAPGLLPTMTYFLPTLDLFANDEAIVVYHVPAAHSDGDSIVFFRRSDVISTGNIFTPGRYPTIDVARGGSVTGMIAALGKILELAVPEAFSEGGTKIIPAAGRITEEVDVAEFRDMLAIIRDRVQDGVTKGQTMEQIKAARPSRDYDAEYGASQADADRLVESIYRSLTARPAAAPRTAGGRS